MSEPEAASGEIQEPNNNLITPSNSESVLRNNIRSYCAYVRLKKRLVCSWPLWKKLLKLGPYSSCQAPDCQCLGWKPMLPLRGGPHSQPFNGFQEPCGTCTHNLQTHAIHLVGLPDDKLNALLELVVDCEYIVISTREEKDQDTRRVWFYLFRVVRKCIRTHSEFRVEGPFGSPPFEEPTINVAIANFIMYKYGTLKQKECQKMYNLGSLFLNFFNLLNLETPTVRKQRVTDPNDITAYKIHFTRWLICCYIPKFHHSLERHEASVIFGRTMLRAVFETTKRQLMTKCLYEAGSGTLPTKIKDLILINLTPFMDLLEKEVYDDNSPIWDPTYKPTPPAYELPDIFKSTIK